MDQRHTKVTEKKGETRLQPDGRYSIIGPSKSGKSELLLRLIADPTVWVKMPQCIVYCTPKNPDEKYLSRLAKEARSNGKQFIFHPDIPTLEELRSFTGNLTGDVDAVLCLDDFIVTKKIPPNIERRLNEITLKEAHHNGFCMILIQQIFFHDKLTSVNSNLCGRFILYQRYDASGLNTLSQRIFPGHSKYLLHCSEMAHSMGESYIFVNTDPLSGIPRMLICYTKIFEGENGGYGPLHFEPDD